MRRRRYGVNWACGLCYAPVLGDWLVAAANSCGSPRRKILAPSSTEARKWSLARSFVPNPMLRRLSRPRSSEVATARWEARQSPGEAWPLVGALPERRRQKAFCISSPHIRASALYGSYAKRLVGAMI